MQRTEEDEGKQATEDAYQDVASMLEAVKRVVDALGETRSRSRLSESIDLANYLLGIEWQSNDREIVAIKALPVDIVRQPLPVLEQVIKSPTRDVMDVAADKLFDWVSRCGKGLTAVIEGLPSSEQRAYFRGALKYLENAIAVSKTLLELEDVTQDLESKNQQAQETLDIAQESNTAVGAENLSNHFSTLASSQAVVANAWTLAAMALLAITAGVAFLMLEASNGEMSLAHFARLTVTLPLAGAGVYAARIAGHYRHTAQWAHSIAVQLKTIRAYSDSLSGDSKNALRYELGARAFGTPGSDLEIAVPPSAVEEPLHLLERATALLKIKPGSTSTE